MKMIYAKRLHIRSCFASWSSSKVDLDWKKIAYNYLSSSSARHFSDNLEGIDFSEQKRRIFSNLKSIWNQAYVYSLEEHNGTYDSTEWLMEKYKDKLF